MVVSDKLGAGGKASLFLSQTNACVYRGRERRTVNTKQADRPRIQAIVVLLFCDFHQSGKIFQNSIAFVGRIDDTSLVATKKFSNRLTRVVRLDEEITMKTLRSENVTKTTVHHGVSGRWFVTANGVTLGEVGVARHQPDPVGFRTREIAKEKARQLRAIDVIEGYPNGPVYAVQR
jgi:hypothetical protein